MWSDIEQTWFLQGIGCTGTCECVSDTVYDPGYPGSFDGEVINVRCQPICGGDCLWGWSTAANSWILVEDNCLQPPFDPNPCECPEPETPGTFNGQPAIIDCRSFLACPTLPCEWIWLEIDGQWQLEDFACVINEDPDWPCFCDEPPDELGSFDGESRISGSCHR